MSALASNALVWLGLLVAVFGGARLIGARVARLGEGRRVALIAFPLAAGALGCVAGSRFAVLGSGGSGGAGLIGAFFFAFIAWAYAVRASGQHWHGSALSAFDDAAPEANVERRRRAGH